MPALATRFKSPVAADQYLSAYQTALALWPVPHTALEVDTRFGATHLNLAGAADLPPLVLIHGFGVSSTIWWPNVAALSRHFRVYAPDVINQMGCSVPTRRLQTRADCAAWLGDVLQALHLDQTAIVGHSYGGWLALNLALTEPQRVTRLALLSPAASFGPLAWGYLVRFMAAVLVPTRAMIYRSVQAALPIPPAGPPAVFEQLVTAIKTFKMDQMPAPVLSVFSDAELGQLRQPIQLLVGAADITCQPQAVLARARRLVPQIQAELMPGGTHLFPMQQAQATNERLLAFLKGK